MATILNDAAYMALPMNIKRGNPIPLDTTAVWYSKTELETYAQSGATAYVGQVLALVEDGKCEAYMISSEAGTLVKLAQTTASGDLASDVATLQGKVDSLVDKVGSAAQGETAATGLYALIATAQAQADKGVTNAANAQTTAEAAQSDVNALKTTVGADDENGLRARIKANETAISTLQGEDTTKSVRTIASEEVAKIVDGADTSFDTLKEIAEWISTHGTDAADLSAAVTKLQAIVAGIGGEGEKATVVAYVTDAINALQIGDYAKAADLTALAGRVDTLEKKPAAGITAKQIEAWDAKQDAGNYVDQSAYNTKIAALEEADTTNSDAITAVKATADKAVPKNAATQAGTGIKVTVDSNGLVTGLAALTKEDIPTIEKDQVNGLVTALSGKQDNLVFETNYDASTNKAATMSDIGDAKNTLVGTAEDKSTVDTIKGAKKYADEKATSALTDAKAYADGLVTGDAGVSARVTALEGKVDVDKVSTAISTAKTEAINDASSKDAAIKSAILGQTDGVDYSGTVKGAYEAAATADGKAVAAQNAVDALSGKVGTIADGKTAAGLISENATAISGINTKIGTVTEGKTIVEMIADAKTAATYDDAEVKASIQSNKSAIDTLNGDSNVDGSVDKKVADAINEYAAKVSDDQTVNTFKELIDYAASHQGEYSTLSGEVQANKTAIATLNGKDNEAGSVAKTVKDAVEAAQATLQGNIDKKVDKVEGKGLSTNDYTTDEKTKLEGIADGAQVNVIETVKVNGVALTPADKAVDVTVPTGALADKNEVAKADLAADLKTEIEGKLNASAVTGDLLTHNASEFAAADHDHDDVYSKLDHNHKIEDLEQTDYIVFDCGTASTII